MRLEYHNKKKTNGSVHSIQVADNSDNTGDLIYYNTALPLQHTPDAEGILVNSFVTTVKKLKASEALEQEYLVC